MTNAAVASPKVVSQSEWLAARKELLAKEKDLTRRRDALAGERRNLPWVKVEKSYVFEGPSGKVPLADLFDGRSQLIIYHFMFGPDWQEGCPSCSFLADSFDSSVMHLAQRDVTLVAVSRAPFAKIQEFQNRMGWRFRWFSSFGSEFNYDFHVSFTKEELEPGKMYYNYGINSFPKDEGPGASVFYKDDAGNVFHTYSTYARGLEQGLNAYNYLDITPKGRNEEGITPYPMAWVRHHDRYPANYFGGSTASSPVSSAPQSSQSAAPPAAKSTASSCCGDH
ncbi:MAG TPA: thioredoxin family protein [Candidatus Limnocylindrales bacterium]|nr:thioredoxin family protein [Candidatus Limnocylindrales bacterium]